MNKYNNSKIYTIRSHQTDKFYIGSTTKKYLSQRMANHKSDYRLFLQEKQHYISSYDILQFEDAYIELLENFNCNNKDELLKKEGEYIRQYKDQIVNLQIEGKNKEKKDEINKKNYNDWYEKNKEKRKQYQKEYREKNKNII
jgi:hypothetical protein